MFQVTLWRVDASCGIKGAKARSMPKAYANALARAGEYFLMGNGADGTRFGPDKRLDFTEGFKSCARRIRRANCVRASWRDSASNITVDLERVN